MDDRGVPVTGEQSASDSSAEANYRDSNTLLDMPSVLGRSHYRTQGDIHRKESEGRGRFARTINFLKNKWLKWAWHYARSRFGRKHRFNTYPPGHADNGIYPLRASFDDSTLGHPVRLILAGDWATGTRDAFEIGRLIQKRAPHFTIHLGDIYYVGTRAEVRENMLEYLTRWKGQAPRLCYFPWCLLHLNGNLSYQPSANDLQQ